MKYRQKSSFVLVTKKTQKILSIFYSKKRKESRGEVGA